MKSGSERPINVTKHTNLHHHHHLHRPHQSASFKQPSSSQQQQQSIDSQNEANMSTPSLSSPTAFLNHHANRIKSKLLTPQPSLGAENQTTTGSTLAVPSSTLAAPNNWQLGASQPTSSSSVKASSSWTSAKNNLIILANAAAIELYFLCLEDETDAEKLCMKCSEKFFIQLSLSETILQAPLIASCIQVLGRLALRYPALARTSVKHLTDFLIEPSPILLKQYRHIIEKLNHVKSSNNSSKLMNKTQTLTNGKTGLSLTRHLGSSSNSTEVNLNATTPSSTLATPYNNSRSLSRSQTLAYSGNKAVSYSKSTRIFEFLRDLTIECLCL